MHSGSWMIRVGVPVAMLTSGLFGCAGNDAGGSSVVESPNVGETTEVMVTAATGGEVALTKAGITLSVPPGALSEDTKITAEVVSKKDLTDAASLAGNVVVFGPNGLKFDKPVSLQLDLAGATIPKDAKVTLAFFDEAKKEWTDLEGSKLVDGKVTADTTHFTMFAVRFVVTASGQVVQESGMCTGTFKACGGNLEGTWNIVSGCADFGNKLGNATAQCAGASIAAGLDITGNIVVDAATITGTLTLSTEVTQTLPKSCVGGMCPQPDPSKPDDVVFTDKGDTCEGKQSKTESNEINQTYTVDGNTIMTKDVASADAGTSMTTDAGTKDAPDMTEYCVEGNTLNVSSVSQDGTSYRWTAKRK
jgi:hypothetical protein